MTALRATPPRTPLDALRALLQGYAEGQEGFASDVALAVQKLRRASLKVVGPMLLDSTRPKSLKRALLGLLTRFDWPDWIPLLEEALARESDLGLFDEGCAALGGLGFRAAREALARLADLRPEPDRQVILQRELSLYVPQQPLAHYLSRLQEGQGNVRLAHQGAKFLSVMVGVEDLALVATGLEHADPLVQRLTLKVVASIPHPEAARRLLGHLDGLREEREERRALQSLLDHAAVQPRNTVRETLLDQAAGRFGDRDGLAVSRLRSALGSEDTGGGALVEPLRLLARGPLEAFLVESLALLLDSKVARFGTYHAETSEANAARLAQVQDLAEYLAELLVHLVTVRVLPGEEVLPVLASAFRARLGGDGLLQAYLACLPVEDETTLASLLAEPDHVFRQKCIDALGGREEDALTGFFLQAMQDPIVEVGQLAIHHLGRLPSSFRLLMGMFESGQIDSVRRAIRVFGENRIRMAAEPLVDFLRNDTRDDLLLEAVEALAEIRHPGATQILLDLLHDGKPLALQLALGRALAWMETPEASLGLLAQAPRLKQPQVLLLALEGALAAFPDFQHPLPLEALPGFLALLERCCDAREGEGQQLPAMLACEGLHVFDQAAYVQLKGRFSDFLSDLRLQENWDREVNDRIGALAKEMGRRAEQLGRLSKVEAELRQRMQKVAASGPTRADDLLALRDALGVPDLILRPPLAREVADFVLEGLQQQGEWREVAHLCEIGGVTGCLDLVDPIRSVYQRATGLGLRSASQKALQALGLTPAEMMRRPPVHTIVVLEPSAFFRRRLVSILAQNTAWEVKEAGSREEAEILLQGGPVDALVTEHQDAAGDLGGWVDRSWQDRRIDRVILSTANRAAAAAWEGPKMAGVLFKPYPPEQLADILGA